MTDAEIMSLAKAHAAYRDCAPVIKGSDILRFARALLMADAARRLAEVAKMAEALKESWGDA